MVKLLQLQRWDCVLDSLALSGSIQLDILLARADRNGLLLELVLGVRFLAISLSC